MSGRHRRAQVTGARRALAGTVPVLGLAGVVTAAVGSSGDTTQAAGTALVTTPIPAPSPVGLEQPDLGIGPDVTTVADDASKAAGQAGARQREQERRAVDALVADVRGDARARDAAADRQGREQLNAFHQDVDQLRADQERADAQRGHDGDHGGHSDHGDDGTGRSCSWSDFPQMGGSTDGDEIVGRDCGLLDMFGEQRSSDPWIDGQLLSAQGDDD